MIILDFKRKIRTWTGIQTSDLQISRLTLYYLSNPGSIGATGQYLSCWKLGVVICDLQISRLTLYHLGNPGSIGATGLNISCWKLGVVVCDTVIIRLANYP